MDKITKIELDAESAKQFESFCKLGYELSQIGVRNWKITRIDKNMNGKIAVHILTIN